MTENQMGGIVQTRLNQLLDDLSARDAHIKAALDRVGYPPERRRAAGYDTLLRVIVGQQVSVQAASSIYARVSALMEKAPDAHKIPHLSDNDLRSAGLSRQKISYARSLSDAVLSGNLPIAALPKMNDKEAVVALTRVKGIGAWSAEMYLMSSLGREDIWPVLDIAVQEGVARMLGLNERPKPKTLKEIGERWRPARSAVALLAWHYYAIPPI